MTTYKRSDRRHWRYHLRRLQWRINLLLAVLVILLVLLPAAAEAGNNCPGSPRPNAAGQCVRQIDRRTVCAWPVRFNGKPTAVCVRQAVEVQP